MGNVLPPSFFQVRIWRSPQSPFYGDNPWYGDELDSADKVYSDTYLSSVVDNGFNGIWLKGILRDLVPSSVFPEFGRDSQRKMKQLNGLVKQADRHRIGVYLYLNEPLAFPANNLFWKRYPDVRGSSSSAWGKNFPTTSAFCTSNPRVRDFLRESTKRLFQMAPGLQGVFIITASEFHSHCYSHVNLYSPITCMNAAKNTDCPRCQQRLPAEVVAEVIRFINDGVRAVSSEAEVIAWNWSWAMFEPDPQEGIIKRLPKDVIFMADFERSGKRNILGQTIMIDEYSLSYIGPSPRFMKSLHVAKEQGLKVYAKVQVGTTHEIVTVPNLPLISNLYRKFRQLRALDVSGFLGCWSFGNEFSLNTFAVSQLIKGESLPGENKFLSELAREYFPGCRPRLVVEAWRYFCQAMKYLPFSQVFAYYGPVNYSLSYPIPEAPGHRPMGESWRWRYRRGNRLEDTLGPFSLGQMIKALTILVGTWEAGLKRLDEGLGEKTAKESHARAEQAVAHVIYHQFRSARNIFSSYRLVKRVQTAATIKQRLRIIKDEIENLQQVLTWLKDSPKCGFHPEPRVFFYNRRSIMAKIKRLKCLEVNLKELQT